MRRAKAEVTVMPVLESAQLRPEDFPAARVLPQLRRLHHRHRDFQPAGAVHFLAHHVLHFPQDPQSQRQPVVEARRQLADQAGSDHQLMADDLRVGGGFLDGVERELTGAHDG